MLVLVWIVRFGKNGLKKRNSSGQVGSLLFDSGLGGGC